MVREGFLLVHKPAGVTSHDVVQVVRRKLGVRRVGHTGTLDPMAEGLLILLVGSATAHQQALQGHDKLYEAIVQLGAHTDTGDAAGVVVRTAEVPALDRAQVETALAGLEGAIMQTPPAFSAVKVRGRPAYWWARRRQQVPLQPRAVRIHRLSLLSCEAGRIAVRVHCSSGTYIRTLAEAIAERLGTVGHVAKLVRLGIGAWGLERAVTLTWIEQADAATLLQRLQPTASITLGHSDAPPPRT